MGGAWWENLVTLKLPSVVGEVMNSLLLKTILKGADIIPDMAVINILELKMQ